MSLDEKKFNKIVVEHDESSQNSKPEGKLRADTDEDGIAFNRIVLDDDAPQKTTAERPVRPNDEIRFEELVVESPDGIPYYADDYQNDETPTIRLNRSVATATVFDWLGSLITALVLVLLIMTFCFRIIDVDGRSMEPTLIDTDKVAITNLFYTPHQGDIVIISHAEEYQKPLVKRVIATAGQELRIDYANNAVYVDGQLLDEPYIQGVTVAGDIPESELNTVVPEGKVFVMGDNRSISLDSRYRQIGYIDEDSIIGKAQLDVIPHKYEGDRLKFDITGIRYVYK